MITGVMAGDSWSAYDAPGGPHYRESGDHCDGLISGGQTMARTPRGLKQSPEAGCSFSEMKA